jgi:hypothetical protein
MNLEMFLPNSSEVSGLRNSDMKWGLMGVNA